MLWRYREGGPSGGASNHSRRGRCNTAPFYGHYAALRHPGIAERQRQRRRTATPPHSAPSADAAIDDFEVKSLAFATGLSFANDDGWRDQPEGCAASGIESHLRGSFSAAGLGKNAFHRRWPMTWGGRRQNRVRPEDHCSRDFSRNPIYPAPYQMLIAVKPWTVA